MEKRTLVSFPIVVSVSQDGFCPCSSTAALDFLSEIQQNLNDITGVKFDVIPFFEVEPVTQTDSDDKEMYSLPYLTKESILRIKKGSLIECGDLLSNAINEQCSGYIGDESLFKTPKIRAQSFDCDSVIPYCVYVNLLFLSSENSEKEIEIKKDDLLSLKVLAESFFIDEIGVCSFAIHPMFCNAFFSGGKVSSIVVNGYDFCESLLLDKYHSKINELMFFDASLKALSEEKAIKNKSDVIRLWWHGGEFGHIRFNSDKARVIIPSYDTLDFDTPDYIKCQNFALTNFLNGINVEVYSILDEEVFIYNNEDSDLSVLSDLDMPLKRMFSSKSGLIISQPRGLTCSEAAYFMEPGKSLIESIEGIIQEMEGTGIGLASYIRHDSGECFHLVVTVFGSYGDILFEESFSQHDITVKDYNDCLHTKISLFKDMAERLGIDFWNIEREDDYIIGRMGFPRAEKHEVKTECVLGVVFYIGSKACGTPKKNDDNSVLAAIDEFLFYNVLISDEQKNEMEINGDDRPRSISFFRDEMELDGFISEYIIAIKRDLPENEKVKLSHISELVTDHHPSDLMVYGVAVKGSELVLNEIKMSVKKNHLFPNSSHGIKVKELAYNVCNELGLSKEDLSHFSYRFV